ncbi:hypothetical protein NDU88_005434 [Pleurodeles waltl]|uniref:Uncharacterized protein n=1 Tax=Pleurodeles waltl TaxID=8319 RepID=A0AAV7L0S4_PLEWA|nr:hypothetical protein NDU88_005434 [Pleurodeles waltl]
METIGSGRNGSGRGCGTETPPPAAGGKTDSRQPLLQVRCSQGRGARTRCRHDTFYTASYVLRKARRPCVARQRGNAASPSL